MAFQREVAPQDGGSGHETWEELAELSHYKVEQLAELCQVSTRTLQRHFKRRYGMPANRWLRELRLDKAHALLRTSAAVKEVAYSLKYKQQSHFSREFKIRFGVCPHTLLAPSYMAQIEFATAAAGPSNKPRESDCGLRP